MTGFHSPWPLFGDDLELARSWLRPQLRGVVSTRIGHLAISLGLSDMLLDGMREGVLQGDSSALRQWKFRVARMNGDDNPYRHLIPESLLEHTLAAIAQSKKTGLPLIVQLNGGIGDHIEALSLLLPWAKAQNYCLDLEMSAQRQQQIGPLLHQWEQIRCNTSREKGATPIPAMALRAAVVGNAEPTYYRSWLQQKQTKKQSERNLLCCWRAEGAGDRLSAHSRSVPWGLVRDFYLRLQRLQPQTQIVDITTWKDWEARDLRGMGVNILDPRQGTLSDLAQLCQISRVVTIDTALVHLCAAAGQRAHLLLCSLPDERWRELHRPEHHYGQCIQLWRSCQFGSWSSVLASLTASFTSEG